MLYISDKCKEMLLPVRRISVELNYVRTTNHKQWRKWIRDYLMMFGLKNAPPLMRLQNKSCAVSSM